MTLAEDIWLKVVITGMIVGPALVLIWAWRRTGSWRWLAGAVPLSVLGVPLVLVSVGIVLPLAFGLFVFGYEPGLEMTRGQYLVYHMFVLGIYGVGFSGMGLLLSLPVVGLWAFVHPRSFRRVVRYAPSAAPEPEDDQYIS